MRKDITEKDIILFNSDLLKAISEKTRQKIIILLGKHKKLCASEIAKHFENTRPSISHHLQVLKRAKVVKAEKKGKNIFYKLNISFIKKNIKNILKIINAIEKG
jgi:DNA-binding transcriptional ArsR family regulator